VTSGNAITINTNQVTLDLNGFTISSTEASPTGTGILLASAAGNNDITILNGHIKGGVTNNGDIFSGPGFANGISYSTAPDGVLVSRVSVSGCLVNGIYLGFDNTTVESCTVQTAGSYGILASGVSHSIALSCGNYGIYADNPSDCHGESGGSGSGVYAYQTANNCFGYSDTGTGLDGTTANNCYGTSNTGSGVSVAVANNCYGSTSSGSYGLDAFNANNCYGYDFGNGVGLDADAANNCYGQANGSGTGVSAGTAIGCYGYDIGTTGTGLEVSGVALGCYGQSPGSGVGINAHIANSCVVGDGTTNITYKYNMP
jgi:hypothetical protein